MGSYPAGELTKQKLYEVAKEVFYEKGYNNASLKEISFRADVKQSAFFYHYKDKSEIANLIYTRFGEKHGGMINDEIRKKGYDSNVIVYTCVSTAVFFFNTLADPNLNRFWSEMYLNNMPLNIDFYQKRYRNMFIKRKLDPSSIDFNFFLISSTSMDGVLLQKYYNKEFEATPEQIVRYKISTILWGLKYESQEIDTMLENIITIAKNITVHAGKNFKLFYEKDDQRIRPANKSQ